MSTLEKLDKRVAKLELDVVMMRAMISHREHTPNIGSNSSDLPVLSEDKLYMIGIEAAMQAGVSALLDGQSEIKSLLRELQRESG